MTEDNSPTDKPSPDSTPRQGVFENVEVGGDISFRDLLQVLLVPGRDEQVTQYQGIRHNLPQPDYGQFIGREQELTKIFQKLRPYPHSTNSVITIDGIGGIGKSALALEVAHRFLRDYKNLPKEERFEAIVWSSAKQTILKADRGIVTRRQPCQSLEDIFKSITYTLAMEDKIQANQDNVVELVCRALTLQRTLLVIDNLETVDDETVMEFLQDLLPAPTKAIVTTRHRLDVAYPVRLLGMHWKDAEQLINKECQKKSVALSNEQKDKLYKRTGGVPLAIVWTVSRVSFGHRVETVLANLGNSQGDIAHFCFKAVIDRIKGRSAYKILLAVAVCKGEVDRKELSFVAGLEEDQISCDEGLVELETLSLINKKNGKFSMLPLTEEYANYSLENDSEFGKIAIQRLKEYRFRCAIWEQSPDASICYGRSQHLQILQNWVETKQHRLITVFGLAGIGKSVIVKRLAEELQHQYWVIWESLRAAPPLPQLITGLLCHLAPAASILDGLPVDQLIEQLIECLRQRPCLIVLDGLDALFQSGSEVGMYRSGYEEYGRFLEQIGNIEHLSCMIVTSRELPRNLQRSNYIRPFWLKGLEVESALKFFEHYLLSFDTPDIGNALFRYYAGNPTVLQTVASFIHNVYNHQTSEFLNDVQIGRSTSPPDVHNQFQPLLKALSDLEQEVLYWLAISPTALSLEELRDRLLTLQSQQQLTNTIQVLLHRSLLDIESESNTYALYPFIRELLVRNFIDTVVEEFVTETPHLLANHSLLQAQGSSELRHYQHHLILQPVANRLSTILEQSLFPHVQALLQNWRQRFYKMPTYAIGNLLNLCVQLKVPLANANLSHLHIRQAYLDQTRLFNVNLSHSDVSTSVFVKALGSQRVVALDQAGQRIAVGNERGYVQIWYLDTGKPGLTYLEEGSAIAALEFSPDGQWLVSGDVEGIVRSWNLEQQICAYTQVAHRQAVTCLGFSPDGRYRVSGGQDRVLRIWNVAKKQIQQPLLHSASIEAIAFSPDGEQVATLTGDQQVYVWTLATGIQNEILSLTLPYRIEAIGFTSHGHLLAAIIEEAKIQVWDVRSGQHFTLPHSLGDPHSDQHFTPPGHTDTIRALTISPIHNLHPQLLFSSGRDRTIKVWDVYTADLVNTIPMFTDSIELTISGDGTCIASNNRTCSIQVWNIDGRARQTLQGFDCRICSFAVSADGQGLAVGDNCSSIHLWHLPTGYCQPVLAAHCNLVSAVAYSPDGQHLVSGDEDGVLQLWDVRTGNRLASLQGHQSTIQALCFSPDGQRIVSSCAFAVVKIWGIAPSISSSDESLVELTYQRELIGHTDVVRTLAVCPDSTLLASGSLDRSIRLWDIATGHCLHELVGHCDRVHTLSFSPDSSTLISGSYDHTVRYWNLETGTCDRVWECEADWVYDIVYTPTGQLYALCSHLDQVTLWDLSTMTVVGELRHSQMIQQARFNTTGDRIITVQNGETVRIWDRASQRCLCIFHTNTPYQDMNITGLRGVSESQVRTLKILGAMEV